MGGYLCVELCPDNPSSKIRMHNNKVVVPISSSANDSGDGSTGGLSENSTSEGPLNDFVLKEVLGKGGFATVFKVELKQNIRKGIKKEFAMKQIGKRKIFEKKVFNNLKVEKRVLTSLNSDFILRMNSAFQDKSHCYFVMEYADGGDVYSFINNPRQPEKTKAYKSLGEEGARFILGCCVLGLQCLHKQNIMYRDLKPQNVVIFKNGYAKLTDFGLSKEIIVDEVSKTMAGTKLYFSPEIVERKGHNKYVDFWTLGVFLHQLILSVPPFDGFTIVPGKFSNLCLKAEHNRDWRAGNISNDAKDLIDAFLKVRPEQRLGVNGFDEIKNHSFFSGFDWQALKDVRMESPLEKIVKKFPVLSKRESQIHCEEQSFPAIEGFTFKEAPAPTNVL